MGASSVPNDDKFLVDGDMKVDNGNITIENTSNYISLPSRGSVTPSILFSSDTNTGFAQGTSDTISLVTSGNERYRFGVNGELLISGSNAGTANQVLTSQGSNSVPTWSNTSTLINGEDISLTNLDISGVLNVNTIDASQLDFTNLPDVDPGVPGRLYKDGSNFIKISA